MDHNKNELLYLVGGVAIIGLVFFLSRGSGGSGGVTFAQADPKSVASVMGGNATIAASYNDVQKTRALAAVDLLKTGVLSTADVQKTGMIVGGNVEQSYYQNASALAQTQAQADAATATAKYNSDAQIAIGNSASAALVQKSYYDNQTAQFSADKQWQAAQAQANAAKSASKNSLWGNIIGSITSIFGKKG